MPTLVEYHSLHVVGAVGLFLVPFLLLLAVRSHVQDLVAVRSAITIFQVFYDVVGFSSSTTSPPSVDAPELNLPGFIGEG